MEYFESNLIRSVRFGTVLVSLISLQDVIGQKSCSSCEVRKVSSEDQVHLQLWKAMMKTVTTPRDETAGDREREEDFSKLWKTSKTYKNREACKTEIIIIKK